MTSMIRLTPHAQASEHPGTASRAVDAVERTLLVVARRAFLTNRQQIVADTAAPAALIAAVSAPNPPITTTAGNGPVPPATGHLGGEARALAVLSHIHIDAGIRDRPGNARRLLGLLAVNVTLGQLLDLGAMAPPLRLGRDAPAVDLLKGSGNFAVAGTDPGSVTAQSAPSSSTGDAAAAEPGPQQRPPPPPEQPSNGS